MLPLHHREGPTLIAGLDLGQANDYSALVIAERIKVFDDVIFRYLNAYHIRFIRRWRGIEYGDIVGLVKDIIDRVTSTAKPTNPISLVVDGSGVGRPVCELLRKANVACHLHPVLIVAGQAETPEDRFGYKHVAKVHLVSTMEMLVTSQRLQRFSIAPALPEAKTLAKELLSFTRKTTATGNQTYEAIRESVHDDLVLATALACWWGERGLRQPAIRF